MSSINPIKKKSVPSIQTSETTLPKQPKSLLRKCIGPAAKLTSYTVATMGFTIALVLPFIHIPSGNVENPEQIILTKDAIATLLAITSVSLGLTTSTT